MLNSIGRELVPTLDESQTNGRQEAKPIIENSKKKRKGKKAID